MNSVMDDSKILTLANN